MHWEVGVTSTLAALQVTVSAAGGVLEIGCYLDIYETLMRSRWQHEMRALLNAGGVTEP